MARAGPDDHFAQLDAKTGHGDHGDGDLGADQQADYCDHASPGLFDSCQEDP